MAKALPDAVLDLIPNKIATATRMTVCSGEPANFAGIAAVALADETLSSGDFTVDNAPGGGRQVTVQAKSDIDVDANGTASHVAYDDGSALLAVTTVTTPQAVTSGNKVTVAAVTFTVSDPS